jgi:hypothetical protein
VLDDRCWWGDLVRDDEGNDSQRCQEQHERHDDRRTGEIEQRRHSEYAPGADESAY